MAVTAGRRPAMYTSAGGARTPLVPLFSAAGLVAGALAVITAAISLVPLLVSDRTLGRGSA